MRHFLYFPFATINSATIFVTEGFPTLLQTLERTNIFDARVLTAAHADALRALAGPGGLPLLPCLHPALEEGQIVGDYAGQDE